MDLFCFISLAIECPELTLVNGAVIYTTDTTANYDLGTVATHSCNDGFVLQGSSTRTCMDDDGLDAVGVWSNSDNVATCGRTFLMPSIPIKLCTTT